MHRPHDDASLGELMHTAFRRLRMRWMHTLAPFDITPHQLRALSAIVRGPGHSAASVDGHTTPGALRLKDLAARLNIAARSATEVVDQLAQKGLVERTPDPQDRRATLISLTDLGIDRLHRVREIRARDSEQYFSRLSDPDREQLGRILRTLIDNPAADQE